MNKAPKTLLEAVVYFADPDQAFDFAKSLRWPNGNPVCPHCGCLEHSFLKTRSIWKCKGCRRQFSLRVGTIFEDSPIGFDKWLPCIWLIANSKNSISSYEVARALGVTQKTSWFMLHRIREAMAAGTFLQPLSGVVEVDETYIGGKLSNKHRNRRRRRTYGGTAQGKIAVQGALQRGGDVVATSLPLTFSTQEMHDNVVDWVEPFSTVYSDEHQGYRRLDRRFAHKTVNHSADEFVSGDVYTNSIESFWSLFKRSIHGTQMHISREHADRYVSERTFAYNYRDESDLTRMRMALAGAGGCRLTWKELVGR